jgi:hypothetical protein
MNRQGPPSAATALLLLAIIGLAADHPDLSGTWVVDANRSDFGTMPVPEDLVIKLKVSGPELHVTQLSGEQSQIDMLFNTEGKEMTNNLPGAKMTSKHRWEADVLVGEIKITGDDGNTVIFRDRISLSADGKVQTVERGVRGPGGDSQMKLVFNKKMD